MEDEKLASEAALYAEMGEQPMVARGLLRGQSARIWALADRLRERAPRSVVLLGRGSSRAAAVYGRFLFEIENNLPASLAEPSVVSVYGANPRMQGTLVVALSQSGQGTDLVRWLESARREGAETVAIVNDSASPLALAAETVLDCQAGPELCVPATKSLTAQMLLLAMLSLALRERAPASLEELPEALSAALELRPEAMLLAEVFARRQKGGLAILGRGFALPVAQELSLKLKECAQLSSEAFSPAEFQHGPTALVDRRYGAVVVDVGGHSSRSAQVAAEVIDRMGLLWLLRCGGGARAVEPAALQLTCGLAEPWAPIAAMTLAQLFAFEVARAKGLNPASPRGLQKVTVTR